MDFRPILYVVGLMLCILSIAMALPLLVDLALGNPDWKVFFFCILATGFFGGSLVISTAQQNHSLNNRQAFMLLFVAWVSMAAFGALPFFMSEVGLSITDSFFEAMSGITTTGATVIVGLDDVPPGILVWRALLQWLGGIGIVMMAMSVLPFLKIGGMQLFRTETGENERSIPRMARLAQSIGLVYTALTVICVLSYMLAGMNAFNAFTHGLTTISTGGFSTYDASFGYFDDPWKEFVAIIFMILGALPFILYVKMTGGKFLPLVRDTQVQAFLSIIAIATVTMALYLIYSEHVEAPLEAFRQAAFNVVSSITGTGFTSANVLSWGSFVPAMMLFLMATGGCAGSTTCGIKIFRFQVLYEVIAVQVKRLLHPNGVFVPHFNHRPLPPDVPLSVMSFFFIFAISFMALALALSFVGMGPMQALVGAISSLSNAGGPGLGTNTGEITAYAALPDNAKWILSFGMLLGRLEILTVLVFLLPQYWRR